MGNYKVNATLMIGDGDDDDDDEMMICFFSMLETRKRFWEMRAA